MIFVTLQKLLTLDNIHNNSLHKEVVSPKAILKKLSLNRLYSQNNFLCKCLSVIWHVSKKFIFHIFVPPWTYVLRCRNETSHQDGYFLLFRTYVHGGATAPKMNYKISLCLLFMPNCKQLTKKCLRTCLDPQHQITNNTINLVSFFCPDVLETSFGD